MQMPSPAPTANLIELRTLSMKTAVNKQEFLNSIANVALRTKLANLVDLVNIEFHESLLGLLRRFSGADLGRFADLWSEVPTDMRTAFVAFVVSGDDPDGRFLAYLDESESCQEAIDLAFRVHVEDLHDLGRSVAKAEKVLQKKRHEQTVPVVSVLAEANRAEDVLESLEERLETMASIENSTGFQPLIAGVKRAMAALHSTKSGLEAMAGK